MIRFNRQAVAFGALAALLLAAPGCASQQLASRGGDAAGFARAADSRLAVSAAPGTVIRAQSQDGVARPQRTAQMVSHEGVVMDPSVPATVWNGPAGCPPQGYGAGPPAGPYNHCGPGLCGPGHTYSYADPGVPVYPQGTAPGMGGPGSPAAMVQYPYYTTKGPDDFFLDEDGKY